MTVAVGARTPEGAPRHDVVAVRVLDAKAARLLVDPDLRQLVDPRPAAAAGRHRAAAARHRGAAAPPVEAAGRHHVGVLHPTRAGAKIRAADLPWSFD